jgi:putative transposase
VSQPHLRRRRSVTEPGTYPTDLTDDQWALIEPHIPPAKPGGRARTTDMREVVNGIQYLLRDGGGWRGLPHDLPPWGTVHYYYRRFRLDGTWAVVRDRLRERCRWRAGRAAEPSLAVVNARSVKTTGKGGSTGTTRARMLRATSGTWRSTRSGW